MKSIREVKIGILQIPVTRIILLVTCDILGVLLASVLSLYVRYDFRFMEIPQDFWYGAIDMFLPNVLILLLFFTIFRVC